MSARYSSLPALNLEAGPSELRRLLLGLCCGLAGLAAQRLWAGGYAPLVAGFAPLIVWQLRAMAVDRAAGVGLHWRGGQWYRLECGAATAIDLLPGSVRLPWLIHIRWRESGGRRGDLWLFIDSAGPGQLRALRRRLVLQG